MYRPPYTPPGTADESASEDGAAVHVVHRRDVGFGDPSDAQGLPLPASWKEPAEGQGLVTGRGAPKAPLALVPVIHTDEDGEAITARDVELRQGPWSLLLAAALHSVPEGFSEELVEDALLRRSDAALSKVERERLRPLADQVAALEAEYHAVRIRYEDAEDDAPKRDEWVNPQHYLEAMKVHERRMDRLQRGVRDVHERYTKAVLLLERVRQGGVPTDVPAGTGADGSTGPRALGVEVEVGHASGETSRVRVGTRG